MNIQEISNFMSTCSDTLVEETTRGSQIQVMCQASQGQNPPGIRQTLEEYSSFAGQITSSPSLPAEHVHSLFPSSKCWGLPGFILLPEESAGKLRWILCYTLHIHNSSSEQGR